MQGVKFNIMGILKTMGDIKLVTWKSCVLVCIKVVWVSNVLNRYCIYQKNPVDFVIARATIINISN